MSILIFTKPPCYTDSVKIFNIIPVTKIPLPLPQTLSYFSSAKNLKIGGLVSVPIGKRKSLGIVMSKTKIEEAKMNIKTAGYQMKPIDKIVNPNPVVSLQQLKLAVWMHKYYHEPLGLIIKGMAPVITSHLSPHTSQSTTPKNPKPTLLKLDLENCLKKITKEIKKTIALKKQILILAPDKNTLNRLKENLDLANCGESTSITGSTSKKKFEKIWEDIVSGKIQVILGTRKALFLPYKNLGLVFLTQEHSPHYKSWNQHPKYHTRDVAIKLAKSHGAKIIMQSETPSVEASWNLDRTFAPTKTTTNESHNNNIKIRDSRFEIPNSSIIDMRIEIKNTNYSIFSLTLLGYLKKAIEKKEKIILFINRRGESSAILCRSCGYIVKCKNCDVPMAYHSTYNSKLITHNLTCHHCNYKTPAPNRCPQCNGFKIKFLGAGTQKVVEEIKKISPETKTIILDSDTAKTDKAKREIIDKFQTTHDILVGTQSITSLELPKVNLIGVVSSDAMVNMPSFRSSERTFQTIFDLINKLEKGGKIVYQTYSPEHHAIKMGLAKNYKKFYEQEIIFRKMFNYPPFAKLIKLTFSHRSKQLAEQEARSLHTKLMTHTQQITTNDQFKIQVIGPAPAFIPRQRGKYIFHIIMKITSCESKETNSATKKILRFVPSNWSVDVDPESLL